MKQHFHTWPCSLARIHHLQQDQLLEGLVLNDRQSSSRQGVIAMTLVDPWQLMFLVCWLLWVCLLQELALEPEHPEPHP
jgi:hypothetical protein